MILLIYEGRNKLIAENKTYNGWKNWETWNVALWLQNEYPIYCSAKGYTTYKSPFLAFRYDLKNTFGYTKTKDNVSLWDANLDIKAIDEIIQEL